MRDGKSKRERSAPDEEEFSFFTADLARLDEEWLEQPRRYYEHARRLADARLAWERAKADRDVTAAEVELDVRADPAKYNLAKVTEAAVEKTVLLEARCRRAERKVREAKHAVDVIQAAVDALEHKKRSLEKLVDLFLANYFAAPRAQGGKAREWADNSKADRAFGRRKGAGRG